MTSAGLGEPIRLQGLGKVWVDAEGGLEFHPGRIQLAALYVLASKFGVHFCASWDCPYGGRKESEIVPPVPVADHSAQGQSCDKNGEHRPCQPPFMVLKPAPDQDDKQAKAG